MKTSFIAIGIVAVLIVAGVSTYMVIGNGDKDNIDTGDHKDLVGNEIKSLDKVDSIVCLGQNSLRVVTYLQATDKVKMVDINDSYHYVKTYMYAASKDIYNLPHTHTNCGITADDARDIIDMNPDVIIMGKTTCYDGCANEVQSLYAAKLNIVVIDDYLFEYLDTFDFTLNKQFKDMIRDVGYAINESKRAEEFLNGVQDLIDDVRGLVADKTTDRTAYMGCVSYNGTHPLDTSIWSYTPFTLAGIKCILPKGTFSADGNVSVASYSAADLEKWSDEKTIIFVDANGYTNLTPSKITETSKGLVKLWADNDAYMVLNYVGTGMNYENGLVNAYQIIRYIYGDSVLTQAQFDEKADKVYDVFFGTHITTREHNAQDKDHKDETGYAPLPAGSRIYDDLSFVMSKLRGAPTHGVVDFKSDGSVNVTA